jgi:hypothetical protein
MTFIALLAPDVAQQGRSRRAGRGAAQSASPLYDRWLTPKEYGSRFGISFHDLDQIQSWLRDQGLQVEEIPAGLLRIIKRD